MSSSTKKQSETSFLQTPIEETNSLVFGLFRNLDATALLRAPSGLLDLLLLPQIPK